MKKLHVIRLSNGGIEVVDNPTSWENRGYRPVGVQNDGINIIVFWA